MRTNYATVATLVVLYLCQIIALNGENDDDNEGALKQQDIKGLPIIPAQIVFDEIGQMIESPDETVKTVAKDTLEDIMKQMQDKTTQFAKLTMRGVRFAINLGAENTALRAQNEAVATKLWNLLAYIFNGILSFFGLTKRENNFNIRTREEIFSVPAIRNLEPFTRNDNEFVIHAIKHTIAELEEFLEAKRDLMQHVQDTVQEITKPVIDDVKRKISHDEVYKKELETYLQEKEQAAKKYTGIS